MAKSKHSKPEEFYLGTIRSLKKENLYLRKRVQQLETLINEGPREKQPRTKKVVESENNCPGCARGTLQETEFAGRVFDVCFVCNYRSKLKKLLKKK